MTAEPDGEAASRPTIDLDELAQEATALVARLVGDDRLDELVAKMLDHDSFPTFLWRDQPGPVAVDAIALAEDLRHKFADRDGSDLRGLDDPRLALVLDPDLPKRLIQLATTPRFCAIPRTLLHPPIGNSKVLTAIPWLLAHIDDRGLLELVDGVEPQPDVVFIRDWAVPYHQFLRRGFGARVNDALIGELLKAHAAGATVRVAIDERRMRARGDYRRYLERDYWNGPPINAKMLDDPSRRGVEILQHGWPAGKERFLGSVEEHLSVRTYLRGTTRTIEIEEITLPALLHESEFQLVRYLHAERDIEQRQFTHVDGAVRFYDRAVYEAWRGVRWPTGPADAPMGRRKVFRVDGAISTTDWVEIVAQWFRGSELLLEALAELTPPKPAPKAPDPDAPKT
jgi:hypothetical protein